MEDALLISMRNGQGTKDGKGGLHIVKRDGLARPHDDRYWAEGSAYEFRLDPAEQSEWQVSLFIKMKVEGMAQTAVDVHKLGLYRLEEEDTERWVYVGGIWNASSERLEAAVARAGVYAIFAFQPSFIDLRNHWAKNQIERLAAHHVIDGVEAGRFAPERSITRAEMAALLIRQLERDTGEPVAIVDGILSDYNDIEADKWYVQIVQKAASSGLMTGSDGFMRPDDFLTREEAAALTLRAIGLATAGALKVAIYEEQDTVEFVDEAEIAAWARPSVLTLANLQIIHGFPDGRFSPKSSLTRAQAASLLWETYQMNSKRHFNH